MPRQVEHLHEFLVRFDEFTGQVKASHVEVIRGMLADDGKSWVGKPETAMVNVDLGELGTYKFPDGHLLVPLKRIVDALQAQMLTTLESHREEIKGLIDANKSLAESHVQEKTRADQAEKIAENVRKKAAELAQAQAEEAERQRASDPTIKTLRQTLGTWT